MLHTTMVTKVAIAIISFLWVLPLAVVLLIAFRGPESAWDLNLLSGWTTANVREVWNAAPFLRYYANTTALVVCLAFVQVVIGSFAAYAFARYPSKAIRALLSVVLVQLLIFPEVLLGQNYWLVSKLGFVDSLVGVGLPYAGSAFVIFLLTQSFRSVPRELVEAAELEGASRSRILWKVYLPMSRPVVAAFAVISVFSHWNNFLWPLIVTRSPESRPISVGIVRYISPETGVDFAALTGGTVIVVGPLLVLFILIQKRFIANFMQSKV